jgi:hypothetical protein
MSGLVIALMLFDGVMKLIPLDVVISTSEQVGIPGSLARPLGVIGLVCTLLYAFPRSSVLGAILLTGYLGGAIASHFRLNDPIFTHTLFGLYLGLLVWGGLAGSPGRDRDHLRDARLRALVPLRAPERLTN